MLVTDQAIAIRLADEGVPIQAIGRVLRVPPDQFRDILHDAVDSGRICFMPKEDWPPMVSVGDRGQCYNKSVRDDDDVLFMKLARVFKTTQLQSKVLLRLLRRGQCTKEAIHEEVEDNRGNPAEPTNEKIVDVLICHLRKKLKPFGISILTIHSQGYSISVEDQISAIDMLADADNLVPSPGVTHAPILDQVSDRNARRSALSHGPVDAG